MKPRVRAVRGLLLAMVLTGVGLAAPGCSDGVPDSPWIEERTDGRLLGTSEREAYFAVDTHWPDSWVTPVDYFGEVHSIAEPDPWFNLWLFEGGFQDPYYVMRFDLGEGARPGFVESVECDGPLEEVVFPEPRDDLDWWDVPDDAVVRGCQRSEPGRVRSVYVHEVEPSAGDGETFQRIFLTTSTF